MIWHEIVWWFLKVYQDFKHSNKELFLFWFLDVQNNFMFPTCNNSQKQVKNQKSKDKHSSFDGLIQEDIDLSDICLAVSAWNKSPDSKAKWSRLEHM